MLISSQVVEQVWQGISQIEKSEEAQALSQSFMDRQPVLAGFVLNYLKSNANEEVASIGYYIAMVVWKIFENSAKGDLEKLSEKSIKSVFDKNEEIFHELARTNELTIEKFLSSQAVYSQPHVLQYLVEAIYMEEDEHQLSLDQQSYLFRCLKVVVDSLSQSFYLQVAAR